MGGRRNSRSTLTVFIQALEGSRIVVELRRDTIVRGMLVSADTELNLILRDASVKALDGSQRAMDELHVRGRTVRFIHLPGNLDPATAVAAHRRRVAQALREQSTRQQPSLPKGQQLEVQGGPSRPA